MQIILKGDTSGLEEKLEVMGFEYLIDKAYWFADMPDWKFYEFILPELNRLFGVEVFYD